MAKLKKHHKIHLSYILIIGILISIFLVSIYFIQHSSKNFVVQQVYYKELDTTNNKSDTHNVVKENLNDFLDEECNLGENINCNDFLISKQRIDVWASHNFDVKTKLTIKTPICKNKAESFEINSGNNFNFVLTECETDIADEKGLIEIPFIIYIENENINKTQLGKISTTIS